MSPVCLRFAACLAICVLTGCGDDASGPRQQLQAVFHHQRLAQTVSARELIERHELPYLASHGLDVSSAEFRAKFVEEFGLTGAETQVLDERGFVVVPSPSARQARPRGAGPVDIYYRIFAADLPIFVSADSLLHAWHRSYDELLEETEEQALKPAIESVLDDLVERLDPADQAQDDARRYLLVAAALLESDSIRDLSADLPHDARAEALIVLDAIEARGVAQVEIAGRKRLMDFSHFIARGHYANSARLRDYFWAMMWLGRGELILHDPARDGAESAREERAARALAGALARSPRRRLFEKVEAFVYAHIGGANALSPTDLLRICEEAGSEDCREESAALKAAYRGQHGAAYATRLEAVVDDQARSVIALRMMPQRFAYDAWVTSRTTAPALDTLSERTMASPLDVAFALGSYRAVHHLRDDMRKPGRARLPTALAQVRKTMHELPPSELEPTMYNHWLDALMALSEPRLASRYPRVMRTAAWHDRQLEAVLGSWTEMRHDTVLLVEQSLGMIGCQYPRGYVEPVPELYRSLAAAAMRVAPIYADERSHGLIPKRMSRVVVFLEHFARTMERLAVLAELELAGEPMSEDDLLFVRHAVDRHAKGYGGSRSYDGWYPRLFWTASWSDEPGSQEQIERNGLPHTEGAESKPVVADVHTDMENERVLQLGVSHPELLVVAIDDASGEVALYGGPVFSVYSFESSLRERMTDQTWRKLVAQSRLPERPSFARSYRAR